MHRNNCEHQQPDRPLPAIWRGTWTTATGRIIEGRIDFALYEQLLMLRAEKSR